MDRYKTYQENYREALAKVRQMATQEIKKDLGQNGLWHQWYVDALHKILKERQGN